MLDLYAKYIVANKQPPKELYCQEFRSCLHTAHYFITESVSICNAVELMEPTMHLLQYGLTRTDYRWWTSDTKIVLLIM